MADTASQAYAKIRTEVEENFLKLGYAIERLNKSEVVNPDNWNNYGELVRCNALLQEALNSFKRC